MPVITLWPSASSSPPSDPPGPGNLISFSFGGTFVDITALTTLIGSSAAESLVLGNHGAAGIAWATMSAFGLVWVIRACIGAASPGWLRETMGIRTPDSDLAIGMELSSTSFRRAVAKTRRNNNINGPQGLVIESNKTLQKLDENHVKRWSTQIPCWREVYAFNLQTSLLLSEAPDTEVQPHLHKDTKYPKYAHRYGDFGQGTSLTTIRKINHAPSLIPAEAERNTFFVYTYTPYTFYRHHHIHFQITVLALSVLKLGELFALRAYGGGTLMVIVIFPWAYFFAVAVFLEAREILLAHKPEALNGHLDILAGRLPSMTYSRGTRKIILGAPCNPRTSLWWRIVWAVGAVVCLSSLILTYIFLKQQANEVVLLWTGFQLSWMLARLCVYHFGEPTDGVPLRMLVERPWDSIPESAKARVLELMVACAQYQTLVHPRTPALYNGDSFTSSELASILIDTPLRRQYPLPNLGLCNRITVNVRAVVGDTTLASAVWISGLEGLTPEDLYDCCIAIPAIRFFASIPEVPFDVSTNPIPQVLPKGSPCIGSGTWWYHVPCENGLWLQIKANTPDSIIGKQNAELVDDAHITDTLARGDWRVSLVHVDEIKRTVELSEMARQAVVKLLVG